MAIDTSNSLPIITKNLPYNKFCFERIISQMKPEHISMVSIEVWAEEGIHCLELLRSGLSGEEFDKWASKASRMLFTGLERDLVSIGVA